jgi:ABC-type antimicrobial peptide transport system permease subunit
MREGMRLTLTGAAISILLAVGVSRVVATLLFGVSPVAPLAYVSMSALLIGVAFVAIWLPARRAAGSNPLEGLRAE